jgi:HSP20 family molecular chaperone IbpA
MNAVREKEKTMEKPDTEAARKAAAEKALVPPVDIVETPDGITLTADLPGVSKEGLSVRVDGDTLSIEGDVSLGEARELQGVYAEVGVARYKRSFVLSRDLDASRIEAGVKNGVLTLRVPRAEQAKPRRIEVRAD